MALLFRDLCVFSGDHLWGSGEAGGGLDASRDYCWDSWDDQVRSMERLLDFRFRSVLPGHGPRYEAPTAAALRADLEALIGRMRRIRRTGQWPPA